MLALNAKVNSIQGYPFGWDDDGFRGHVFATPDNSTIIVSIKGTSAGWVGGGGPTSKKDKMNDNILFSCCCAAVGFSWTPVCGCHDSGWKCKQNCLEQSLVENSLFYGVGTVSVFPLLLELFLQPFRICTIMYRIFIQILISG